jgi:RNA polymerase sigma-70 factor, ECF subfamily
VHVDGDPLEVLDEGRIEGWGTHGPAISSFALPMEARNRRGVEVLADAVTSLTLAGRAGWEAVLGSPTIASAMASARSGEGAGVPPVAAAPPVGLSAAAAADGDVALMLRVQGGDEAAFRQLFDKFSPRVMQYARRYLGSHARAEEVTQDVFVQVFRFRHRYRPESRFAAWLFTIATNHCLNELRRPERRLRVDLWDRRHDDAPAEPPLPDHDAPTPEAGASSRELSRELDAAVSELPAKQRAALLLSRVDGLAYRDVGEALGCSEGAVKALLFRATQTLKRKLRDFL